MLIYDLLKMALRSLIANKMRTFLTTLGIIIGVASVISMISIGEGTRQQTFEHHFQIRYQYHYCQTWSA